MTSSWGFKNNVMLDNNKYIKLSTHDVLGIDNNNNINFNSGSGDLYINSNNTGSYTFLNSNNSNSLLVPSTIGIGINTTSNINANLTIVKNGFIGVNTTQGSNDGFLGLAGSSVLDNTSGSRIILKGNELGGSIDIYAGNNTSGNFNVYTGNDSNVFKILNNGTSDFSPNGSTIRLSINDNDSTFTHSVKIFDTTISDSVTTGSIVTTGGVGVLGDVNIGGDLVTNNITANNLNLTGAIFQNGELIDGSQWTGTSGNELYYGTSGSVLVGIGTDTPTSTLTVNGDLDVSGNTTLGNVFIETYTTGTLYTDYVNIGNTSYIFAGSITTGNNVSSPSNVQGLIFPNATTRSFTVNISIDTQRSTGDLFSQYTLNGILTDSGWDYDDNFIGDIPTILFSVGSTGQILYTSTNDADWLSTTLRFQATGYSINSNVLPPNIQTSGNFNITGILSISDTTDSISPTTGSVIIDGGVSVKKSLSITDNIVINEISEEKSNVFSAVNGIVSNIDIPDLLFPPAEYRSFFIILSVSIEATTSLYSQYTIEGIQISTGWEIYFTSLGDTMGITFNITSLGQIQYSDINNNTGWINTTFKYNSKSFFV